MRACTFEEVRAAMTKYGYYVDRDHMCFQKQKFLHTLTRVYLMPDPVLLVASVNEFVRTRRAWYESRENAVIAGVDSYMIKWYIYTR